MINNYVEDGFSIVGANNRYQRIIGILLLLIGIFGDISYTSMPLMETMPIADFHNEGKVIHLKMNYSLCTNKNITINENSTKSDWVHEYNIYCNKFMVSLIGFVYCLGGLSGSIVLQFLKEKGVKFSFILVCLLLCCSSILIIAKNILCFYIFLFISGFCGLVIFILKINIMTDLTDKKFRSYYNNIIIAGGNFSLIINYFLFNIDFNWKFIYLSNSIMILIHIFIFYKIYVENPRFYYTKGDFEKMFTSFLYIAKFNKTDQELNFKEKFDDFYSKINKNSLEVDKGICIEVPVRTTTRVLASDINSESINSNRRVIKSDRTITSEKSKTNPKFKYFLNFILSYPICNFLFFIYVIEIKEYSYEINSFIYWFCLISIFSSFFLSYLMNVLGRKNLKIILMLLFVSFFIFSEILTLSKNSKIVIYLFNRLIMHSTSMVNHTHLNESFPSTIRLKIFSYAFTLSKIILLFAPFVYEYLKEYKIIVILLLSSILLFAFSLQNETTDKVLEDK